MLTKSRQGTKLAEAEDSQGSTFLYRFLGQFSGAEATVCDWPWPSWAKRWGAGAEDGGTDVRILPPSPKDSPAALFALFRALHLSLVP